MTRPPGRQLSEVLHTLGGGRRATPGRPAPDAGVVGAVQRVVAQFGAKRPIQADPTTCGSAALVVLAAAGDPSLARWLESGNAPEDAPPELAWLTAAEVTSAHGAHDADEVRGASPGARFAALQHAVKRVSIRGGRRALPWPGALGTPPWGAARVARFGGVRYTHRLVVDTRAHQSAPLLDHVADVVRGGVPVLLYTGGDTRAGWSAAVPRHVVLLSSPDGQSLETYEPGSGRMVAVTHDELVDGGTPRAAYGAWSHVTWVVLPVEASRSGGAGRGGGAAARG